MKVAVIVLSLLVGVLAFPSEEIDVATLKPRHIWVDVPGAAPEFTGPSSRIINGQNANPGTFGYQAGLVINNQNFCGGSLIRVDFVLTAAHCIDTAVEVQAVLGNHVIQDALATQQVSVSRQVYVHPSWSASLLQNDVGLVRIPRVTLQNPTIQVVPLVAANAPDFAGLTATLSGWGRTSDDSNAIATNLQVINLQTITNLRCRLAFLGQIIVDQHICTSGSNGTANVGACNGDSGGPLVISGVQVGIVSFGAVRCSAGFPSVFARVSHFINFIIEILS